MHYIFLPLFVFLFGTAFGQQVSAGKPHVFTNEEEFRDSVNQHCFRHNQYNDTQRMGNYPFSNASTIRVVSFKKNHLVGSTLPKKGKEVDLSGLFENVLLEKNDIDTLTSILYNIGYKGEFYSIFKGCYEPRNAILFLDSKGKVFSYIELCFECHEFRVSSNKVVSGQFCVDKYDMLASFFVNRRVEYGTLYRD